MRGMSYDGRAIGNFVLDFCDARGRGISNLALQKIVYFCHVWSLIELHKPLIKHKFEAWELGPVLPYLYRDFREFDRTPIKGRARGLDPVSGDIRTVGYQFAPETVRFLEITTDFYSRLRVGDLVELSHVEGGPWHKVWYHRGIVNPGMKIDDAEIAAFYSKARRPFSVQ